MGASATAPPIAAAANHGAMNLMLAMTLSSFLGSPLTGLTSIITFGQGDVVTADTQMILLLTGIGGVIQTSSEACRVTTHFTYKFQSGCATGCSVHGLPGTQMARHPVGWRAGSTRRLVRMAP